MPDILLKADTGIFNFINRDMQNRLFDIIMPVITASEYWYVPILIGYAAIAVWGHKKGRETFIVTLLAIMLSDGVTGNLLKPLFHRLRPFETLEGVNVLAGAYGASFPSAHAANVFTMAFVMSYYWRKYWVMAISFAAASIISYSRIYVGVHFPCDVAAGALTAMFYAAVAICFVKGIIHMKDLFVFKKDR